MGSDIEEQLETIPFLEAPVSRAVVKKVKDVEDDNEDKKKAVTLDRHFEARCMDQVVKPLVMVAIMGAGIYVCSVYCVSCLIGICVVCICLCPFIPAMNIPLWISMAVLIWKGWTLTNGHLTLIWQ